MFSSARFLRVSIVEQTRKFFLNFFKYSFGFAFYSLMSKVFNFQERRGLLGYYFLKKKHCSVKKWIVRNYRPIIRRYELVSGSNDNGEGNKGPVWVFWWQGEEEAPAVVRLCLASIRMNSAGRDVVLLSKYNYFEYVDIPEYIVEKLIRDEVPKYQFSDVLRVSLLAQQGGIWLDATIFMSGSLDPDIFNHEFYTAKIRYSDNNEFDYAKWTSFFLAGSKDNILFCFLRDFYFSYWFKESSYMDYFMIDYSICVAYENIPAVRDMVDSVPFNNQDILSIQRVLNAPYDESYFQECSRNTYMHKLTWKKSLSCVTDDNEMTFFGFIVNRK